MARAIGDAVGWGGASGRALESLPPYGARYPDVAGCGTAVARSSVIRVRRGGQSNWPYMSRGGGIQLPQREAGEYCTWAGRTITQRSTPKLAYIRVPSRTLYQAVDG